MYDPLTAYRTMSRYNRWMNEKLYAACAALSGEQRTAERGAFFHSIHGTLNHLLLADRLWLGRFLGRPFAARSLDQELYSDFEQLRRERAATDLEIESWINSLDAARLNEEFRYTGMTNPQERAYPMWLVLTHFFNHQTHHRGQLTTLMNQVDCDSGVTDLIAMPGAQVEP